MQKPFSWYLMKLDRIAAWTLLGTMVLYFISGYGMTKGIIPYNLAINIHNNWLPIILLLSFCFHTYYAINLALKRWRVWGPMAGTLLISTYIIFFGSFLYINNYYQKNYTVKNQTPAINSAANNNQVSSAGSNLSKQNNVPNSGRTFTKQQLAQYDGTNGDAAYVAVSGKVYDVSGLFVGGKHQGCQAGQDITAAFLQIHNSSFLNSFSVVGTYSG